MQLKEIHIKGFKSFAEGIRIRFEGGITGVVGPNGCGKSNFVDAIRWVLGEQKVRNLRTERMQHLIFNGTQQRKPLHMAEVSLNLAQTQNVLATQHADIQLTRRLYRSGESEYAINKIPSRLRDITDLTLDSGLSAEAYSIIELKMVEDILSDKEGSRRHLFEHAAGIAKFKVQKREALLRLGHTESDLHRIDDLLHELDKNLRILKKQAEKALQYAEMRDRYAILRAWQAAAEQETLKAKYKQLSTQLKQEESTQNQLHGSLHKLEAAYTARKAQAEKEEKDLQSTQRTLNTQQQQAQQLAQALEVNRSEHKLLQKRTEQLLTYISEQKQQQQQRKEQYHALEKELHKANIRAEAVQKKWAAAATLQQSHTAALENAQKRTLSATQRYDKGREALQTLGHQKSLKEAQKQSLKQQQQQNLSTIKTQEKALATQQQQQSQVQKDMATAEAALHRLLSKEKIANERLATQRNRTEKAREALNHCLQQLQQQRKHAAWLSNMQSRMEGLPEGLRWLRHSGKLKAPLLVEVLELAPAYATVLGAYLAPYAQHLVLKSRKEAENMLALLQKHNQGPVACFILEELPPTPSYPPYQAGIPATEQISCEDIYLPLRDRLLAGVQLIKAAAPPASLQGQKALLHTEGAWLYEAGQLKGGSTKAPPQAPDWGLKARLKTLQNEIQAQEAQQKTLQAALTEAEALLERHPAASLSVEKEALQTQLQSWAQAQAGYQATQKQHQLSIQNHQHTQEALQTQEKALKADILQLQQAETQLLSQQKGQQQVLKALQAAANYAQSTLQQSQKKYQSLQLAYAKEKSQAERLAAEQHLHKDYLESATSTLQKEQEAYEKNLKDIDTLQKDKTKKETQWLKEQQQNEALQTEINQSEARYYESRGLLSQQEKELHELQKKHSHAQLLKSELQSECTRVSEQLKHLEERIFAELKAPLSELLPQAQALAQKEGYHAQNMSEVDEVLQNLNTQMQAIGNINPLAAESFQEMEQRREFIAKEQKDLLQAKDTLENTLQEIEKTTHKRFTRAFTQINTHFQDTFKLLFSAGDVCALQLGDKNNTDEPPIHIIAQPKGKRPMHIEQLSSGEKTLTAIALLIAIYLYKPAPFCILDEVDAPLDDANSAKFNQLIRSLSDQAQFILITHNKHTMRNSDILYGFTMPEAGVTRILPVDLRTLDKKTL